MSKIQASFSAGVIICLLFFVSVPGIAQNANPIAAHDHAQPSTFMERAIEMNHAEIQLGKLALTKVQDNRVREFAETIVSDHTETLDRLGVVQNTTISQDVDSQRPGSSKDVSDQVNAPEEAVETVTRSAAREKSGVPEADADRTVLTREHQQALDRLSKVSGAEFDKQFIDLMVREHRTSVQQFEREAGQASNTRASSSNSDQSSDPSVIARELLPQLRQHLSEAEQLQKQLQSSNRR